MLVRDGEGAWIDFRWPSLWYWFKVSLVVTVGWFLAAMFLAVPAALLTLMLMGGLLKGVLAAFH
jgi:hypothetical protein